MRPSPPEADDAGRRRPPLITRPEYRLGKSPPNKGRTFPPEPLTPGEVRALLAECASDRPADARMAALIVVLWRSGLRISEALALFPKDVNLPAGTLTVLHGKRDKRRVVGIDAQACLVLEGWLERRRQLGLSGREPVFCTVLAPTPGRPWCHAHVRDRLKELAALAGIEKRVHPHGFRHTHAVELAMEGVPVHLIRRQLGHDSLDTTERYISHLAPVEVIEAMQRRTWAPGHAWPS